VDADWDVDFIFSSARSEVQVALHFSCERGVIVFQNKKHIFNCGRGTDGETDISLASGLNKIISTLLAEEKMKSTSQSASTRQLLYLNCSVCKH
jgi:hypothetical protein